MFNFIFPYLSHLMGEDFKQIKPESSEAILLEECFRLLFAPETAQGKNPLVSVEIEPCGSDSFKSVTLKILPQSTKTDDMHHEVFMKFFCQIWEDDEYINPLRVQSMLVMDKYIYSDFLDTSDPLLRLDPSINSDHVRSVNDYLKGFDYKEHLSHSFNFNAYLFLHLQSFIATTYREYEEHRQKCKAFVASIRSDGFVYSAQ